MIIIILSLIIFLSIIIFINHKHKLKLFIQKFTSKTKLFDICAKYFTILKIEVSLKTNSRSFCNSDRYTIPGHVKDINPQIMHKILSEMNMSSSQIKKFIKFIYSHITPQCDIIFGIDNELIKVYTDDGRGNIYCIDSNLNKTEYHISSNKLAYKYADRLHIDSIPEFTQILTKTDKNNNILSYHARLATATSLISHKDAYVYWISFAENSTTFYVRPRYWYDPILNIC